MEAKKDTAKPSAQLLRSDKKIVCANCGNERSGSSYDSIIAKRTFIRYEGYMGTAHDSFVTKKVPLCDVCVGRKYRNRLVFGFVISILATLLVSLLFLWPGLNNFSGGHWSTGIVFAVLALIPLGYFMLRVFPAYVQRFNYLANKPGAKLSDKQLLQVASVSQKEAEKLAVKITEKKTNADPVTKDLVHNIFLTPTDYKALQRKSTTELPQKRK